MYVVSRIAAACNSPVATAPAINNAVAIPKSPLGVSAKILNTAAAVFILANANFLSFSFSNAPFLNESSVSIESF